MRQFVADLSKPFGPNARRTTTLCYFWKNLVNANSQRVSWSLWSNIDPSCRETWDTLSPLEFHSGIQSRPLWQQNCQASPVLNSAEWAQGAFRAFRWGDLLSWFEWQWQCNKRRVWSQQVTLRHFQSRSLTCNYDWITMVHSQALNKC